MLQWVSTANYIGENPVRAGSSVLRVLAPAPCSALPVQAALTLWPAAGAQLSLGTGLLHLLFSLARVFLSLLFQGNPLRSA